MPQANKKSTASLHSHILGLGLWSHLLYQPVFGLHPHQRRYLLTSISGTLIVNPMYFSLGSVDSFFFFPAFFLSVIPVLYVANFLPLSMMLSDTLPRLLSANSFRATTTLPVFVQSIIYGTQSSCRNFSVHRERKIRGQGATDLS